MDARAAECAGQNRFMMRFGGGIGMRFWEGGLRRIPSILWLFAV